MLLLWWRALIFVELFTPPPVLSLRICFVRLSYMLPLGRKLIVNLAPGCGDLKVDLALTVQTSLGGAL